MLTVNETYDINGTYNVASSTIMLNINNASSSITLYLNGSSNNLTVRSWEAVNITALTNATGSGLVKLSMNASGYETNFTNGTLNVTNITSSLPIGIYRINASYDGNNNYSSSSLETLYLFVTNLNFSGNLISSSSPIDYDPSRTYNFSINLTGSISNIIFESTIPNGTLHDYTNNTSTTYGNIVINKTGDTYWISFPALPAVSYQYRWIANDTNNIWVNTTQLSYIINPYAISSPSLICTSCSFSTPPWIEAASTSVTLSCSHTLQAKLTISGGVSSWYCYQSDGNLVSCSFTTGSTSSSDTYTCSVSGNYTSSPASGTLTWSLPTQNQNNLGTAIPTQNTTGSFTITPSSYTVTMEPNTSKVITLTFSNTLSNDIININISVSGLNSSWYTLDKTNITRIKHDIGTNTSKLTLNVSKDAERKTYNIVVSASGKDAFTGNKVTNQTTITLTVPQAPQNATEETGNVTNATNATVTETNVGPTGLSIKPEDIRNIVLFIGLIAVGLVFLFRSNITEFLTGGLAHKVQTPKIEKAKEESKEKKASVFSSIKNKLCKLNDRRLVIQVKKKDKEKA
jgi:hypothetical protein